MPADELIGTELGDYRPLRVLGRGGMGVVYQAEDLALRRRVALKVLRPDLAEDRTARARFQQEIDHAVAIEHPHVVPVYSAGYERPHFYIAMRLIAGPDLSSVLDRGGALAEARALRLLGQVASALAAVHARGLVHRDVKPHNVLVFNEGDADDEHAMLTDFGIAKALEASRGLTGMGAVGTPAYMAPEVLLGRSATPASDQYAFACLAYELLSGRLPYDTDAVHAADAHIGQEPLALARVAPHVTPAVADAVHRGLAKNPDDRHPTIRDLVRAARPAAEAFDRSEAITRVLTETSRPSEAITRLLSEHALTDATIARITDVDPADVARQRRRQARSALVGRPASHGTSGARDAATPTNPFARIAAAAGSRNSSRTRVQPVFGAVLERDPSGADWLPALLAITPARDALPAAVRAQPGTLLPETVMTRSVRAGGVSVELAQCFERRIAPPEPFLRWCIEHPERLTWPRGQSYSPDAQRWRRALIFDEPPGRRAAQAEALAELRRAGPEGGHSRWWTFEGRTAADCLLVTDRLALFIEGKRTDRLAPATAWYPQRSQLVRNLEALHTVAAGRYPALLLLTESREPDGAPEALERSMTSAAPHRTPAERTELARSYLGQVTWRDACAALGVDPSTPPDTTAELR